MNDIYIIETIPCLIGIVLSLIILPRMRQLSSSGMFFSDKDGHRDKKGLVELGGLAVFPILLVALCICLGLPKWLGYDAISSSKVEQSGLRILQVIAGSALLYIVGLKNDIHGTSSGVKSLALFTVSCMFPVSGLWIMDLQGLFGFNELPAWIGMLLSTLLVMYLTETIAMLDDMDGLGAGVVTIMSGIFLGFCVYYGFTLGALVSSALLGVSLPYAMLKVFSPRWKKVLIGNSGSLIMGYVLSYLTLSLTQQSGHSMPHGMLMIAFGITLVPMFDVVRMVRLRVREGRSIMIQDRNQMQHRFIRMGIKPTLTPVLIVAIILVFAAINTLWVISENNLTMLALIDLVLWMTMQFGITYGIKKSEEKRDHAEWNMVYGREAWEANVPVETIRKKRQTFGSMGLPSNVILGEEIDFIPDGMNAFERNVKRLFDMTASGIMLVLTSPLFLLSYVLIKLDDGGPAIYAQERLGRFGRPFKIYKFRSMRLDAEKFGPALSHAGGDDDPRLTKVGKFLRAHHLDELPQLWNVFCGDMAFIGYRPERKFFIDQIMEHDPRYSFLYQIRPGVTSYATLYNGYTDTMEKMLRRLNYDLYYLEHRSFWFDIKTLWLTFISIIFGKKF